MAIKKKPEEHENHERWLISYADFITLLFAFFVVMYSSSSRDLANIKKLEVSLMKSFGSHSAGPMEKQDGRPFADAGAQQMTPIENRYSYGPGEGHDPEISLEDMYRDTDPLFQLKGRVDGIVRSHGAQTAFQTKIEVAGLRIVLTEDRVFNKNGDIKSDRQKVLLDIAKELRGMPRAIAVEGTIVPTSQRSEKATEALAALYAGEVKRFLKEEGRLPESKVRMTITSQSSAGLSRPEDLDDGLAIDIVVTREKTSD